MFCCTQLGFEDFMKKWVVLFRFIILEIILKITETFNMVQSVKRKASRLFEENRMVLWRLFLFLYGLLRRKVIFWTRTFSRTSLGDFFSPIFSKMLTFLVLNTALPQNLLQAPFLPFFVTSYHRNLQDKTLSIFNRNTIL